MLKPNAAPDDNFACTVLFALSIAGDCQEGLSNDTYVHSAVVPALTSVMHILGDDALPPPLRKLGITCLTAFSTVVANHLEAGEFRRVVRLAVIGMHDRQVCYECVKMLDELAQEHGNCLLEAEDIARRRH